MDVCNLQTKGSGNCLFHMIRGCLRLRKSADKEAPFYPCRYLRRAVVAHMAHQRHRIMKHKGAALRSTYGIANNELSDTPISYKPVPTVSLEEYNLGRRYSNLCPQ